MVVTKNYSGWSTASICGQLPYWAYVCTCLYDVHCKCASNGWSTASNGGQFLDWVVCVSMRCYALVYDGVSMRYPALMSARAVVCALVPGYE